MFSSTIIPTINRHTLATAVLSVLNQDFEADNFEVIVVNDSGTPLPSADWQNSDRVKIINTDHRERSVARNTGAAIAKGKYLHFLDDDDFILPGALNAFWNLDSQNHAAWLYGSYRTIDNSGNIIEEIHPEVTGNVFALLVAGESFPFQISLIKTDLFFQIGGFDSSPSILGVEDRDVGRRLSTLGPLAYTPTVVGHIRIGEVGSTTNWQAISERDRWGREKALNLHDSFTYLRKSTDSCKSEGRLHKAYWRGRVCRSYFASAIWNIQRKNFFTAASRGVSSIIFAGKDFIKPDFYRGLRDLD